MKTKKTKTKIIGIKFDEDTDRLIKELGEEWSCASSTVVRYIVKTALENNLIDRVRK